MLLVTTLFVDIRKSNFSEELEDCDCLTFEPCKQLLKLSIVLEK